MQIDYDKQANDMLAKFGIEFRAVLVGDDCPAFCEDAEKDIDMDKVNTFPRKTHIHGKHYRCTFSAKGRGHMGVDFWNSYADEEENAFAFGDIGGTWVTGKDNVYWDKYRISNYPSRPRVKRRIIPTPYDVLACLTKNDPGSFDNFCSDFGYDTDSRKAEESYKAVVKEWLKVRKFFTDAELEELQEVA